MTSTVVLQWLPFRATGHTGHSGPAVRHPPGDPGIAPALPDHIIPVTSTVVLKWLPIHAPGHRGHGGPVVRIAPALPDHIRKASTRPPGDPRIAPTHTDHIIPGTSTVVHKWLPFHAPGHRVHGGPAVRHLPGHRETGGSLQPSSITIGTQVASLPGTWP